MRILKYFLLLIILISNLYSQIEDRYSFGISMSGYDSSNQNRIKRLSLNLLDKIRVDYQKNIDVFFYEDDAKLLKDFEEKNNINALIIFSNIYLRNKEFLKNISKNPYVYRRTKSLNSKFYLVANKKSNIKSINDLKGKTFIHSIYEKNYALWLDYLTLKKFKKSYNEIILKDLTSQKTSTSLLDVYFEKADFCVIDKEIYEDVVSLNPSIIKNLSIIEESPEIFISSISVLHKDVSSDFVDFLNKLIISGKFEEDFRELFSLIDLDNVSQIEFKDLDDLDKFYDEYKFLKNEYK